MHRTSKVPRIPLGYISVCSRPIMATRYLLLAVVACLIWPGALGQVAQVSSKAVKKANDTSSDSLDARLSDSVNSQVCPGSWPRC